MTWFDPFPARNWVDRVTPASLRSDLFAGFTNAAIVLPQGVAFATIAGLPPEFGLYTAMVSAIIAALFGSSLLMISGPTTAISAVLFATLSDFAVPTTERYIALALALTVMVGVFQIIAGIARLGGLVSFVSHSVMTAFTAAAAVLIGVSQLAGALGVEVERGGNVMERLSRLGEHVTEANGYAVLIAGLTFGSAVLLQRFAPKLPGFLIALLIGSAVAYYIDASAFGVEMVAPLSAALPSYQMPDVGLRDIGQLAPGAAAIALVGLLEAISIGRTFALRRKEQFNASQEMVGQGLSNAVGGFFQCYAGSGSFTRSGVNFAAGAVTPLSGVFASLFLALILLFVAPYVVYIPTPAMAGLIFFVALKLINFQEIRHIVTSRQSETLILVLTLAAGLLIELDFAIYVGVITSLCVFVYDSARPEMRVITPTTTSDGRRKFRNAITRNLPQCPQVLAVQLNGPLYFGSVEHVQSEFKRLIGKGDVRKHVLLYLSGSGRLDLAGADMLIDLIRETKDRGGTFHIVTTSPQMEGDLEKFHVTDVLGEGAMHLSKGDAIAGLTAKLDREICRACMLDVFRECDEIRDEALD